MTSSLKVWINGGRTQSIQPKIFLQKKYLLGSKDGFSLGILTRTWLGWTMDAFHHEKQLHPLCWLLSGNRFIISIFTSPLIGSWTIDHAPGLAVRVSLMVSGWIKNQDPNQPQRERDDESIPQSRSHNTCYDRQWHPWLTALSLLLRYQSVNSSDALALVMGHFSIHCFPFIFFLQI